jgi:hypothetical protein
VLIFKFRLYIFFILVIFNSKILEGQEVKFYFFDRNSTFDINHASSNNIINLQNWQVHKNGNWENITIPFICTDCSNLNLKSTFRIDSLSTKKKVYLKFQSAGGSVEIYLNQKLLQFVPNAQIPVKLNILNELLLVKRPNELTFKFKIPKTIDEGYPVFTYLYTEPKYLGIFNPVQIDIEPDYYVKNFKYEVIKFDEICEIKYNFDLHIPETLIDRVIPASIDYSILGSYGKLYHRRIKTIQQSSSTIEDFLKISKIEFWKPDLPIKSSLIYTIARNNRILYKDTLNIAFRTCKSNQKQFFLNGEKIIIKGINYYQNYLNLVGKDYFSVLKKDLITIKRLGFNTIRFPGYFPNADIVSIADSLGLLLFAELPIRRYPVSLFQSDNLLENTKISLKQINNYILNHPSIYALGIGQEIPLYQGSVQKFYLIINGFTKSITSLPMYLSPIPSNISYRERIADFYMLDIYRPLHSIKNRNIFSHQYGLAGKLAIIHDNNTNRWDSEPSNLERAIFLTQEIQTLFNVFSFNGGFIESYQDWLSIVPTHLTIKHDNPLIMPDGIMQINSEPKHWLLTIDDIWGLQNKMTIGEQDTENTTNFFSLLMLFASLVFFAIYHKQSRLKDNLKRAIRHPYGFFVDLRERRIIPLFNSFLVGAFSALILAVYLGSFFYYYRDSFWIQEIFCLFLKPLDLYQYYLKCLISPVMITVIFFIILFTYPIVLSIILYLINLFSRRKIRYRQGLAIALWSGIPLFFLLPISLIGYHLLFYLENQAILFIILGLFIIWSHFRIINGIRVLFITRTAKIFTILLLSYIIPVLILWAVFRPESHWYDYFILLLNTKSLF